MPGLRRTWLSGSMMSSPLSCLDCLVRFVPRIGAGSTPETCGSWSRGWGWAERREIIVIFKL